MPILTFIYFSVHSQLIDLNPYNIICSILPQGYFFSLQWKKISMWHWGWGCYENIHQKIKIGMPEISTRTFSVMTSTELFRIPCEFEAEILGKRKIWASIWHQNKYSFTIKSNTCIIPFNCSSSWTTVMHSEFASLVTVQLAYLQENNWQCVGIIPSPPIKDPLDWGECSALDNMHSYWWQPGRDGIWSMNYEI